MTRRVVVTGLGAITPVGNDIATMWRNLVSGVSGIGPITHFDTTGFDTCIAGEVRDFDATRYVDRKEARRMDGFVQYAVAATAQALEDSGLEITPDNATDIGCIVGSGIGGLATLSEQYDILRERGPRRVSPFLIPMMIGDMAAGQVSIQFGLKGTNMAVISACATGAHAIGEAFETIRRGDYVAIVAGGAERAITPIGIAGFNAMRALSTRNDDPAGASRPFDRDRDGFVMGDGAGILVLEEMGHAVARGATIHAEVLGYGSTADATHITVPEENGGGATRAMLMALRKAGLPPAAVDYINAHGTSTPLNDRYETMAIKGAFGADAYRLAVSSTKSMTGHLLGAAGAVEALACILTIRDRLIPPTINLHHPDPECDLDYVPNQAREAKVEVALSNSMGFGGHNVSLVFGRYRG